MTAAQGHIGFVAADLNLCPVRDGLACFVLADHHGRLFPAMANGADFAHFIRQSQERGRSRKQLALKIHAQSITHDRHIQVVDHTGQLPNLLGGQKLCLINKDTGAGPLIKPVFDLGKHILVRGKGICIRPNPDP